MTQAAHHSFRFQKIITTVGVVLFVTKLVAWYITNSVAILTDALESTINVISGFIGLYSLYLSSKPKDQNHPYGHGKVEFVSAAVEGSLISVAGLIIIYEAINNFKHPHPIGKLDYGVILVAITALINFIVGYFGVKIGQKNNSLALVASGRHLMTDTYSTIGIIVGLVLMMISGKEWLDGLVALIFAFIIIYSGYKIIRDSLAGIMDEADDELLEKVVDTLHKNRKTNWIDLHNLRIIKYGSTLHLDCHMTVPWYFNVYDAHEEVKALEELVKIHFGDSVEMFIHVDPCIEESCKICTVNSCIHRQHPLTTKVMWTMENISDNSKHKVD